MDGQREPLATLEFGRFKVVPHRRELIAGGASIAIGSRAFDALLVLIDGGGRVIDKDELMRRVWPDRVVEENNLTQNISALRKLLGEQREEHRYILTVPGYGYRFVAPVTEHAPLQFALGPNRRNVSDRLGEEVLGGW